MPSREEITGLWSISSGTTGISRQVEKKAFYNLREDGNYTSYLPDYFDYGQWKYDAESGVLTLNSKRPEVLYKKKWTFEVGNYSNNLFNAHSTQLKGLRDHQLTGEAAKERVIFEAGDELVFRKEDVQFSGGRDPYSLENNRWRIHAGHEESCMELKNRLINHMQHLCLIFDGYKNRKVDDDQTVYQHSPNPFILAINGIQLEGFQSVSYEYNSIFYDQQNQFDAYHLLENAFRFHPVFPKDREDYVAMWASILHQLKDNAQRTDICTMLEQRVQQYKADSAAKANTQTQ